MPIENLLDSVTNTRYAYVRINPCTREVARYNGQLRDDIWGTGIEKVVYEGESYSTAISPDESFGYSGLRGMHSLASMAREYEEFQRLYTYNKCKNICKQYRDKIENVEDITLGLGSATESSYDMGVAQAVRYTSGYYTRT